MTGRALFFSPCAQVCTSGKDGSDEVSSNCRNVHSNYESSWQGLTHSSTSQLNLSRF